MPLLARRAHGRHRHRTIDVTDLFRPDAGVGHVGKAAKDADEPADANGPAGLFKRLAAERLDRRLARLYPAARELIFRHRLHLPGDEHGIAPEQHAVSPRPSRVRSPGLGAGAVDRDHVCLLVRS